MLGALACLVALFGRKINQAEHQLAFIQMLRLISEGQVNPEEAVRAFIDCGAEYAMAHHFGTFQLTDEAIDAPAIALKEARAAAGIAPERFRMMRPGEAWEISR